MRVPVPEKVQAASVTLVYLGLLRAAIRLIGVAGASVAAPGSGRLHDRDDLSVDPREELTARLPVPPSQLAMAREVGQHRPVHDEDLARRAYRKAQSTRAATHAAHSRDLARGEAGGQGRSTITAPSGAAEA